MNTTSNPLVFSLFLVRPSADGSHPDLDFDFLPVDPNDLDLNSSPAVSQWELVNPSDADDDDDDYDCLSDLDSDCYDAIPVASVEFMPLVEDSSHRGPRTPTSIDQFISGAASPDPVVEARVSGFGFTGNVDADGCGYEYCGKYDCDYDEAEEEYDDGLDDELVPRHLRGKFGRERIRKLGKGGCSKMNTSKKSPFLYVKPGCLRGKYCFGVGLKNNL